MDHYAEGSREVPFVRGTERRSRRLSWAFRRDGNYEITVEAPEGGEVLVTVANDLFLALQLLRRQLEPAGWQVAVQGSRRTAWASGMLRDMIGGRRVYICQLGQEVVPREAGRQAAGPGIPADPVCDATKMQSMRAQCRRGRYCAGQAHSRREFHAVVVHSTFAVYAAASAHARWTRRISALVG